MKMNRDDLHFSSCRELPYIDYYQGAAAKKQSIAVEVMTPLYLDGRCISTLISSPEDIDVLAVGYCLAEGKYRLAASWLVSACTMGRPGSRRKPGRHGQQKSRLLCRLRQRSSVPMEASWTAYRRHITPRTASTKGPWSKAMKSSSIRKISAVTMSSTACGASSNYSTSTSVRPSWSSAAAFPQSVIEKVHGLGVRFLASRALPTSLGVSLAEQYQITLACGLRPDSFKIFAHPERVLL